MTTAGTPAGRDMSDRCTATHPDTGRRCMHMPHGPELDHWNPTFIDDTDPRNRWRSTQDDGRTHPTVEMHLREIGKTS